MSEGHPPGRRLDDGASSGCFPVDLYLLDAELAGSLMALEEDIHMVAFDGAAGVLDDVRMTVDHDLAAFGQHIPVGGDGAALFGDRAGARFLHIVFAAAGVVFRPDPAALDTGTIGGSGERSNELQSVKAGILCRIPFFQMPGVSEVCAQHQG